MVGVFLVQALNWPTVEALFRESAYECDGKSGWRRPETHQKYIAAIQSHSTSADMVPFKTHDTYLVARIGNGLV